MQQKKQQKQGKRQEWKDQMKESDRMLKGNVLLEKPQWVRAFAACCTACIG